MKKITSLITCLILLAYFNTQAQIISLSPSGLVTASCAANLDVQVTINITNLTSSTKNLTWKRTVINNVGGWDVPVCDPLNCYAATTNSASFTMNPNGTGAFLIHAYPNGNMGVQTEQITVFDPTDSMNTTMSRNYEVTATAPSGISTISNQDLSVYPNPIKDNFTIALNTSYSHINAAIYNVLGRKVAEFKNVKNGNSNFNISYLPNGSYFLKLENADKSYTQCRLITKQ